MKIITYVISIWSKLLKIQCKFILWMQIFFYKKYYMSRNNTLWYLEILQSNSHHSKMQKDGWAKYIPNFAFKWWWNGLEFFILKFTEPLQSCCCPVQKDLPRRAELAWQVSRYLWRGSFNFKIKYSKSLFVIIFKPKLVIELSKSLFHL